MAEVDLDAVDASWDDSEEPSQAEESVDQLEAGWDELHQRRTATGKAAARKRKAAERAERQRAHAAETARKQKKKATKPKKEPSARSGTPPEHEREAAESAQPGQVLSTKRISPTVIAIAVLMLAGVVAIIAYGSR
jgi:hypothetical protein